MILNIDGIWFERKISPSFCVRVHDVGNGHIEASMRQEVHLEEMDLTAKQIIALESAQWNKDHDPSVIKDRAEKALKVAANRAKTMVRRSCKAMGCDTMLTLTYRANELDLSAVKADLKKFNRRVLGLLPAFSFVAAFERQERGAWHVHIATANIPQSFARVNQNGQKYAVRSYNAIRAIWRGVTGERGGNIDVSRKKAHHLAGAAKIAAYLSKYMLKAFEDGVRHSNRYTVYGAAVAVSSIKPAVFRGLLTAAAGVELCYQFVDGRDVYAQHFDALNGWFFIHAEHRQKSKKNPG